MRETIWAYKFLRDNFRSGFGTEDPWYEGETRTIDKEPIMCAWGYHSSPSWMSALEYALGNTAALVEIPVPAEHNRDDTKQVTARLTVVRIRNVATELRGFACDCAERGMVLAHALGATIDARSWTAIAVARRFTDGKATRTELDSARNDAWDASWIVGGRTQFPEDLSVLAADGAANATRLDAHIAGREAANSLGWLVARIAEGKQQLGWQEKRLKGYLDPMFTWPGFKDEPDEA